MIKIDSTGEKERNVQIKGTALELLTEMELLQRRVLEFVLTDESIANDEALVRTILTTQKSTNDDIIFELKGKLFGDGVTVPDIHDGKVIDTFADFEVLEKATNLSYDADVEHKENGVSELVLRLWYDHDAYEDYLDYLDEQ